MKQYRNRLKLASRSYLSGVAVYSVLMLIYLFTGYYKRLLVPETVWFLKNLYFFYILTGLPRLYFWREKDYKPEQLIRSIPEFLKSLYVFCLGDGKKKWIVGIKDKNLWLFTLVKAFYFPLMVNFLVGNYKGLSWKLDYPNILNFLFTVDTAFFTFGYLIQHKRLGNVVKSVEPTLFGWMIALACYPPFNSVTGSYLGWYSSDRFSYSDPNIDMVARVVVIVLIGLYTWASVSLGFKCSNLTNRGIVGTGAYKWIRHPAYTGKLLAWWIMGFASFSLPMMVSMTAWTLIYYLRAVTEERHLMADPDYRKYVKKVPYRFIPFVA